MPTFATPAPITLRLTIEAGEVRIDASDRSDTEVEVAPANPNNPTDVDGAERTKVEQRLGQVVVEAPHQHGMFHRSPELLVRVGLPTGSHLELTTNSADIHASGAVGNVEIRAASGDVHLDRVERLRAKTASGDLWCARVEHDATLQTASGDISIDEVGGRADLRSASGDARLRTVGGDLKVQTASGDASVDDAQGSVRATAASGDILLGAVHRGEITADAASGDVSIGVAPGTAAWLDVTSLSGDVHSGLDGTEQPGEDEETVEIRARTVGGDISITRASSA